jgi:hypothetical protein
MRKTKESSRLRTTTAGGLGGQGRQQLGGRVDLGEPVELVAGHVEQQRVGRGDELGELQGVPLVELEDGDVGLQAPADADLPEHRREDPAGEVAAGGVGEDVLAMRGDDGGQHLGGRRLAVGARDDNDPARHAGQGAGQDLRVDALGDQPRQGRSTTTQARGIPECFSGDDRGGGPEHRPTLTGLPDWSSAPRSAITGAITPPNALRAAHEGCAAYPCPRDRQPVAAAPQ